MTNTTPLVSVVIPTYNRENRLIKAVQSVENQLYENIELIVVDDYSKHPAENTIEDMNISAINNIDCIRFDKNRGANAARNRGIEESNGEYIAFLDDDDEWKQDKIQRQVGEFRNGDDNLGVVFTGVIQMKNGVAESSTHPNVSGDVTKDLLTGGPMSPFSAIMVKHDIINKAGKPDVNLPSLQDREWAIRLSLYCAFKSIPEPLTVHRLGFDDQKAYNYKEKRDITYPFLINKHRSLARSYGLVTELQMVSWLNYDLATSAMASGYYTNARNHFAKSILYNPLRYKSLLLLFTVIFGKYSYNISKYIEKKINIDAIQ